MDQRAEITEFLASRRARISPQSVGLPVAGRKRRVPGLRREEVAALAGLSVDYYIRLERGALVNASDSVLQAIARALQLDPAEQAHLLDLARAGRPSPRPDSRRTPPAAITPQLQTVLDALVGVPALVRSPTLDLIATNLLARALYSVLYADARKRRMSPGSPSLTPAPASSGPTGTTSPTTSSPTSAPSPAPSTARCPSSSASCPRAATTSASCGPATTCAPTREGSNDSATRSSASSRCTTTTSSSPPNLR